MLGGVSGVPNDRRPRDRVVALEPPAPVALGRAMLAIANDEDRGEEDPE